MLVVFRAIHTLLTIRSASTESAVKSIERFNSILNPPSPQKKKQKKQTNNPPPKKKKKQKKKTKKKKNQPNKKRRGWLSDQTLVLRSAGVRATNNVGSGLSIITHSKCPLLHGGLLYNKRHSPIAEGLYQTNDQSVHYSACSRSHVTELKTCSASCDK